MNQPQVYVKNNDVHKKDATFVLTEYFKLRQWNVKNEQMYDYVLEIGCGPGNITRDILLPFFPKTFKKLIATDISDEMLDYAKIHYSHPNISYQKMNIEAEGAFIGFENKFDHVFSFHCLQWIIDLPLALSNILEMLKPGGNLLFFFPSCHPFFDIYQELFENSRWKPYMEQFRKYKSTFKDSKNSEKDLEKLLKEIGFHVQVCKIENRNSVYPSMVHLIDFIISISPYYNIIPKELRNDYVSEFVDEMKKRNLMELTDKVVKFNAPYKLFTVYAKKPS